MSHAEIPTAASQRENRYVSLGTAILAVFAALSTLFAHHRSITALSEKNQAILAQARASDTFNAYEAKQVRYNIYRALVASQLVQNAKTRDRLNAIADSERSSSPAVREKAKALEEDAAAADEQSQNALRSYEHLQYAAAAFQIAIIFVSISALAGGRFLLPAGFALGGFGLILFIAGLVQNR